MTQRLEISHDEAQKLHQRHAAPKINEAEKLRARKTRSDWADKGNMPEGYSKEDIEVLRKAGLLDARLRCDSIAPEEVKGFLDEVGSLKQHELICDEAHQAAMNVICSALQKSLGRV